jgi:heme-degrading monooxygenase HmoA
MDAVISATPAPPYYAVIFTSKRTESDNGYAAMAKKLMSLAQQQSGFLGAESVRDTEGIGITVSYWDSLESIALFKGDLQHRKAQQLGKEQWYSTFGLRVCKVERDMFF